MANIRYLKMDVKHMIRQFIQECYIQLAYSPPLNQENVLDIISDAMELERDVLNKINNPNPSDYKSNKHYFKQISSDFYDSIVELTERLNSLEY
jgi:hypothetical protein